MSGLLSQHARRVCNYKIYSGYKVGQVVLVPGKGKERIEDLVTIVDGASGIEGGVSLVLGSSQLLE